MAAPKPDNCGNCRYWDTDDENLDADERRAELGVCRIQTYAGEFDNDLAYISTDGEEEFPVLVTDAEFFCNLYKVRK